MKPIITGLGIIGTCIVLFSTTVLAENRYINDSMKITMRTSPGNDKKIVALLNIGQRVEVLKPGNDWTLVQLSNGKQGWVLSRFLTDKTPSSILLKTLQNKHEATTARVDSTQKENNSLKVENEKLSTDLSTTEKKLQQLNNDFEALKKESADFLALKSKYKKSTSKLTEQTKKADKFEAELTKLLWNQNIKWFLSGAGVLILGFIIGFSTKRQKRRSSLL